MTSPQLLVRTQMQQDRITRIHHSRFKSIDLNIVDSITDKSYRSVSAVDETNVYSTNGAKYVEKIY